MVVRFVNKFIITIIEDYMDVKKILHAALFSIFFRINRNSVKNPKGPSINYVTR